MTVKDRQVEDVLQAARRGLSPTSADGERVHRLMQAALAAPLASPAANTGSTTGAAPAALRVWPWVGRLLALGAVAAVAGSVGYRAGRRAQSDANEHGRAQRDVTTNAAAVASIAPLPSPTPSVAPLAARPQREATRRSPAHASPPAPPSSELLAEELRVLRGAERALREDHPGLALALLRELDRTVPDGRLAEERQAVRTIARCASGDVPFGVNLARDFAEHYPGSVYDRRVSDACAATDSPTSGDPQSRRLR